MNYKLNISCYAWDNANNILFDYDSRDYIRTKLSSKSNSFLIKKETKIISTSRREDLDGKEYVATVRKDGDNYFINNEEENGNSKFEKSLVDKLWIVVRNTKFKDDLGCRLREGDKIKLGKIVFKVCELNYESNESRFMSHKDKSTFYIPAKKNLNDAEQNRDNSNYASNGNNEKKFTTMCRICLMDENEDDNPLISPCKCIGSVRFTHLICLRKWLNAKTVIKHFNNLIVYIFKDFECELCMSPIPVDYQRPEGSYLILESISQERKDHKYLYIIQMTENASIRMGRASDADVRVADISVSRNHALLYVQNGNFYIKDIFSKFGTLVQLQNEILVSLGKPIAIQSGKIEIFFSIVRDCVSTIKSRFAFVKSFPYVKCRRIKNIISSDYNDYLKDKIPMYYMQELENVNILDTNYSLNSNDVRSSKKTKPRNEILNNNHEINNDNSDVFPTMARGQNNYGDMTTNRMNESEGNSIIEGKSRNIVDNSSILDNVTCNNIFVQSSIFNVPSPITSRREDRETLNLLASYTRRDIVNSPGGRSTINILNANNRNNNIFNSEKNKEIKSGNDSVKNSYEKKKFKANSVNSKDPKEIVSLKEQILLDSSILHANNLFELDFEFVKENMPYVNKINETSKKNSDPQYKTLDLRSNSLKKEMERLDTFNPNAYNQFGSKRSRKTNSCSGKNYLPVSDFADDFDNPEVSTFNKGLQQSEVEEKLFNSFYKIFKNENKLDEISYVQESGKKIDDKQSGKYRASSQSVEKKLDDKQSAKFFTQSVQNIEKKVNDKQSGNFYSSSQNAEKKLNETNDNKTSKKDANQNQADIIPDQEKEEIFFKNEDDYEIFKNNYEKILDINLNFHSNEEPKSVVEETLETIKSTKRNSERGGSLSNSSFKEIVVNPSVDTPSGALYIKKIPKSKKKV